MIEIIPAIDIIDGKCVRLSQGNYDRQTVYHENPLEVAKQFEDAGLTRLHLVDLDGAKASHIVNWKVLEEIATNTSLVIDFGGGIKSNEDLKVAFDCGAAMVTGGSIAVKNAQLFQNWIITYGAKKILLGADVKDEQIAIHGWQEESDHNVFDFLKDYIRKGISCCICTDISKDGMLQGPAFALYEKILEQFPRLRLIASGGISTVEDIEKLNEAGLHGAIIGKALYEGKIKLRELSKLISSVG